MRKTFDYPLAVYVATFANGETARLSVGAKKGKVDFDRVRGMVARMWREGALPDRSERQGGTDAFPHMVAVNADGSPYKLEQYWSVPDRTDIMAGHVEHDGRIIPDPHFSTVVEMTKRKARKVDAVDAVLSALDKLSLSDLETIEQLVAEMINEKLAA